MDIVLYFFLGGGQCLCFDLLIGQQFLFYFELKRYFSWLRQYQKQENLLYNSSVIFVLSKALFKKFYVAWPVLPPPAPQYIQLGLNSVQPVLRYHLIKTLWSLVYFCIYSMPWRDQRRSKTENMYFSRSVRKILNDNYTTVYFC